MDRINKGKYKLLFHSLLLFVLSYFIVFVKLDSFHMRWWDESMFAVNTYEMLHNGKFFTPYFNSLPDLYNTKPPLLIWIQLIFTKIVGYNELAIRLPSAIAAVLSILLIFRFISFHYSYIWAWLSALILLTSPGFIDFHTARTGESDSLLTFFVLAAHLHFFNYLRDQHKKYIFFFFVFITLAFATKMWAGLLFIPAYPVILIRYKQLRSFLFNQAFIYGSGVFILVVLSLLYLREQHAPGYLQATLLNDAGRIFRTIENHHEPAIFYLENLFNKRFSAWFILLVIGYGFTFSDYPKQEKKLLFGLTLLSLVYLIIIMCSKTKLIWYDMPLFPHFAIIASYPLYIVIQKPDLTLFKRVLFIILIFIYPYHLLFENSQANRMSAGEKALEGNERFIFTRENEGKNLSGIKVYYTGYERSLFFYKYKLAEKKQLIQLVTTANFNENDKILVCNDSLKNLLLQNYQLNILDRYDNAVLLEITGKGK